jgi:hypothetical protein
MRINRRQLRQIIQENLWDNIRKKRARGEKPAKKGDKDYPDEKSWKSATNELDEEDSLDEDEGSTVKYNADPALKGDQTTLPDKLQKGIIDKADKKKSKNENKMKITKRQLRRIVKEEKAKVLSEQVNDVDQIITQGRAFFDRLIELSQASEDDPAAQTALDQIEAALSNDVEERSFGYIKLNIL